MTLDNVGIIADAVAGIGEVGFSATFKRTNNWPASPNDNIDDGTPDTTVTVCATKTARAFMAMGQEIMVAKSLLVPATGFVPQQGDRTSIGSVGYTVVRVETVAPGGVDLLYKVDLAT